MFVMNLVFLILLLLCLQLQIIVYSGAIWKIVYILVEIIRKIAIILVVIVIFTIGKCSPSEAEIIIYWTDIYDKLN